MMQAITDMNIQYEDKEALVVYKPAGLATQSARVTSPDLVSSVTRHLKGRSCLCGTQAGSAGRRGASCAGKDKAGGRAE